MAISFQEEAFDLVLPDIYSTLIQAHWQEIAQDQDKMPLDVDLEAYRTMEAAGGLSIVTVRVDGAIVGYFVSFVKPHLHYKSTLCAFVDVYYLAPEYRHQHLGLQLFECAEAYLRMRGVQKIFSGTKAYNDMGPLFRKLEWTPTEMLYTKWIGE